MKKLVQFLMVGALVALFATGCQQGQKSQESKDKAAVDRQQKQYANGQPIPAFDWSLERDAVIKLYHLRNQKVSTHTVWRSDYGMVEGDCTSLGYGIPYDTSLTNPYQALWQYSNGVGAAVIAQAEPNGIFASTNTSATWVMCIGAAGTIDPVYVESKVTTYPYPVSVDYDSNRVKKAGKSTATIKR